MKFIAAFAAILAFLVLIRVCYMWPVARIVVGGAIGATILTTWPEKRT